jgi:hypothetical protein
MFFSSTREAAWKARRKCRMDASPYPAFSSTTRLPVQKPSDNTWFTRCRCLTLLITEFWMKRTCSADYCCVSSTARSTQAHIITPQESALAIKLRLVENPFILLVKSFRPLVVKLKNKHCLSIHTKTLVMPTCFLGTPARSAALLLSILFHSSPSAAFVSPVQFSGKRHASISSVVRKPALPAKYTLRRPSGALGLQSRDAEEPRYPSTFYQSCYCRITRHTLDETGSSTL